MMRGAHGHAHALCQEAPERTLRAVNRSDHLRRRCERVVMDDGSVWATASNGRKGELEEALTLRTKSLERVGQLNLSTRSNGGGISVGLL